MVQKYLSNRFQRVTVLGSTSQSLHVLSGVPQGSILGPLLILIFVNNLPDSVSHHSSVALFADETKCYRSVNKLSTVKIYNLIFTILFKFNGVLLGRWDLILANVELFTPLKTGSQFIMNTNFLVILIKSLTPKKSWDCPFKRFEME